MQTVFQKEGTFFKGNLHTHSTNSDGTKEPHQVIEEYRSRGYDFIALTDHFLPARRFGKDSDHFVRVTDTVPYRTTDFTTLLGAELHGPALITGDPWHFVAVGLPIDFAEALPDEGGLDIARRAFELGAFVGLAHPAWYALTLEEALPLIPYCHAIEVYNEGCTLVAREDSWHFADALYGRGIKLHAVAADDAHFKDPRGVNRDAFGGWVNVKAASLDPDAILAALKAGNFYSSTGPTIEDITIDGDLLRVRTSPIENCLISGPGARFARRIGKALTECEFPLVQADGTPAPWASMNYFRLTVVDADGRKAWSNPIWRS